MIMKSEGIPGQPLLFVFFQTELPEKLPAGEQMHCSGGDDPAHLLKEFAPVLPKAGPLFCLHCLGKEFPLQCGTVPPTPGAEHAASALG